MLNNAIITGASGLLGRKVYSIFKESGAFDQVVGLAFSRAKNGLIKVDLTNKQELIEMFEKYQPRVLVHCAAERFPDRAEENVDETIKLNIQASKDLSELSLKYNTRMIYISTNYVFDGLNPPYLPTATPKPLNFYGKSKYEGEKAIVEVNNNSIVVRVPILYGETEFPGESMVMILSEFVKNSYKKEVINAYAPRFPTYVGDIGRFCLGLSDIKKHPKVSNILHFSNQRKLSEWEMCEIFSKILNKPIDHLAADNQVPEFNSETKYPVNVQLDIQHLYDENLMDFEFTKFEDFFTNYFQNKI